MNIIYEVLITNVITGQEFNINFLQPGLKNEGSQFLCYCNAIFFLLHRIQMRVLLYDDHGCEDKIFGIFR